MTDLVSDAQALALLSIVQLFVWQIMLHYHPNYFQTSLFARLTYWFAILAAVMSTIFLTVVSR